MAFKNLARFVFVKQMRGHRESHKSRSAQELEKRWPRYHLAWDYTIRHEEVSRSHSPDPAPCPPLVPDDFQSLTVVNRATRHLQQIQGSVDIDRLQIRFLIRLLRLS